MECLQEAGKAKWLGVAEFDKQELEDLLSFAKITPSLDLINSSEMSVGEVQEYAKVHGIKLVGWDG